MTDSISGILLVDKPSGPTSHDVVARVRRATGQRRVGHVGTLDPMAEGLLVLGLGQALRIAQFLTGLDKAYLGTITLGGISSTYDAEGAIVPQDRPLPEDEGAVAGAMAMQLGAQIQLPPPYSAVKVKGKKLYEYARAGEEVPQKPRPVRVQRFDLLHYDPPLAHFEAKVGSGTYIRSMAHNLGAALGCGAYLSRLRRTRVGGFAVEDALPLESILAEPDLLPGRMLSIREALGHLPKLTIAPGAARTLCHGRPFTTRDILEFEGVVLQGAPMLALDEAGRVLSVVEARAGEPDDATESGLGAMVFRPLRVLEGAEPDE
jgi:tRNA pseudouridine55 synthase